MLLPDVIRRFPAARQVFDKYGLKGCGGPAGPNESVAWFARAHDVPLETLLGDLNSVSPQNIQEKSPSFKSSLGDTIYRTFFMTGIAVLLTLGCSWGAVNLFLISRSQNFRSLDYSWILAHGHAMVFGFTGFFIMGFAYQAFPRFKHASLWKPALAVTSLPLMLGGILLQTVAHIMAPSGSFLFLGVTAGLFQIAAVLIFTVVIVRTFRLAAKPEKYDGFVNAVLFWFIIAAVLNPIVFWLFESAETKELLLLRIAVINIPYRDIQLFGVAVMIILGVSLRFLPHAYGFREPSRWWRKFLLWGGNGAIALGVVAFLSGMLSENYKWLLGNLIFALIFFMIALGTPYQYRLFGPIPENERDRGLKFIRAAHGWFILAAGMLLFSPLYVYGIYLPFSESASPFSHAYFGAFRHALTVGFIMMMIIGVSSKVVPTLSGVDVRKAKSLTTAFVLLNAGNVVRVGSQIMTDFTPSAYAVMGLSGFVELAALLLWAREIFGNIFEGIRIERMTPPLITGYTEAFAITPQSKVGDVLARYPETLQVFLRYGFAPLANPVLRRTMARVVTIGQAARREGVDINTLLSDLRKSVSCDSPERGDVS